MIADCGLRIADCGLRTADYLWERAVLIEVATMERVYDCGLRIADCGLRIICGNVPF